MELLTSTRTPAVDRPRLTYRDQVLLVAFGLWMVVGLFVDGWAHDNNKPETFFTPWHGILYSGFTAAMLASAWIVNRHRRPGRPLRDAIPVGFTPTLVALGAFAVGAVGDLVWHEVFGIEVSLEALLSPTHLLLMVSGLVALTVPVRLAWAEPSQPASLRAFLPVVLSLTIATALVGFFLLYLSPFLNHAAGAGFDRFSGQAHTHPPSDPREMAQLLGVASILLTTVVLSLPTLLVLRRWTPPPGTFTLMLSIVVLLFVGVDEFSQPTLILCGVAAGVTGDLLAARVPRWMTAAAVAAVLWLTYFGLYAVAEGGVEWTAELWTGVVVLAALLAGAMGLVAAPTLSPAGLAAIEDEKPAGLSNM